MRRASRSGEALASVSTRSVHTAGIGLQDDPVGSGGCGCNKKTMSFLILLHT